MSVGIGCSGCSMSEGKASPFEQDDTNAGFPDGLDLA